MESGIGIAALPAGVAVLTQKLADVGPVVLGRGIAPLGSNVKKFPMFFFDVASQLEQVCGGGFIIWRKAARIFVRRGRHHKLFRLQVHFIHKVLPPEMFRECFRGVV